MHYMMGGIRVEAEVGETTTPGLFAAGEVAAGLHGSNRLGGNSLTDLLVFGRRAGEAAAAAVAAGARPVDDARPRLHRRIDRGHGRAASSGQGEDPNRLHEELQATMSSLVGIFRAGGRT